MKDIKVGKSIEAICIKETSKKEVIKGNIYNLTKCSEEIGIVECEDGIERDLELWRFTPLRLKE